MSIENIQIIETVSLDFYNNNIKTINVKQMDTDARGVKVYCTEHGKKFKLDTLSHSAFVRYKKPDGNDVFNDCYIQDDGSIIFPLTQQMAAVEGKSKLDILIFCASGLTVENIEDITGFNDLGISTLSTMILGLNIHPNATDLSNVESTYEYSALIDGLARHVAIEKHMEELESTINTNEEQRQSDESARQTSETQRVSAETSRVNAEKNREQNVQDTINECVKKTDDNITEYKNQMNTIIGNANQATNNANEAAQKANTSANNADAATANAQQATSDATAKTAEMQELIDELSQTIGGVINDSAVSTNTTYSSRQINTSFVNKSHIVNNLTTTEEGYVLDARQGRAIQDKIGSSDISSIGDGTITGAVLALTKDYIVEQGTNGIWTYEKWASGKAKCWGTTSMTFNCNSAWGNSGLYHSGNTPAQATYPFSFVEIPLCVYSVETDGDNSVIPMASGRLGTVNVTPVVFVARTSSASVSGKVHWNVKGRWK